MKFAGLGYPFSPITTYADWLCASQASRAVRLADRELRYLRHEAEDCGKREAAFCPISEKAPERKEKGQGRSPGLLFLGSSEGIRTLDLRLERAAS